MNACQTKANGSSTMPSEALMEVLVAIHLVAEASLGVRLVVGTFNHGWTLRSFLEQFSETKHGEGDLVILHSILGSHLNTK